MSLGLWATWRTRGLSPGCRPHVARPGLARTRVCPASGQLGPTLLSGEQRQTPGKDQVQPPGRCSKLPGSAVRREGRTWRARVSVLAGDNAGFRLLGVLFKSDSATGLA